MSRDEITARVARYADVVGAPVALGTEMPRLTPIDGRRLPRHDQPGRAPRPAGRRGDGELPHAPVPPLARHVSDRVMQLHSHDYRNEARCPPGGVLIVGSGQTGLQLAEELSEAGRRVYISVGSAGRIPRRYRGRDIFSWLLEVIRHGADFGVGCQPPTSCPTAGAASARCPPSRVTAVATTPTCASTPPTECNSPDACRAPTASR